MKVTLLCKNRLRNWSRKDIFEILIPPVYKTMRSREEIFCIVSYQVGVMYTPSFVKIPDGGLKIPQNLAELTWNDPSTSKCIAAL